MMRWPSRCTQLRFRLLASFAFILWGTILYTNYTVHRVLHDELPRFELQTLAAKARDLKVELERSYAATGRLSSALLRQPTPLSLRLYGPHGEILESTGSLSAQPAVVRQAFESRAATPTLLFDERRQPYGYQVLPLRSGTTVVGALEVAEELPPLDRFQDTVRYEFAFAGIISCLSVLAVGMYLGGHLKWALGEIKQQTEAIVRGDFERRIPVRSNDEIGQIGSYLNQMAEDLHRLAQTRNEFFSKVSHELRTPLTIAKGFTSMLSRKPLAPEQERTVRIIEGQIDDLTRLVNDLLDLSRRQGSNLELQLEELDCGAVLAEALEQQRQAVRGQKIALEMEWKARHVPIRGDRQRLHQIIGNLVGNAVRYSRSRIVLELDADERDAIVRVRDDGPGIAPDDLPRIFEPFFQTRSGPRGRMGLGLTVVRELVLGHGGTIDVDSTLAQGTSFTIRLPRVDCVLGDEPRAGSASIPCVAASRWRCKRPAKRPGRQAITADQELLCPISGCSTSSMPECSRMSRGQTCARAASRTSSSARQSSWHCSSCRGR